MSRLRVSHPGIYVRGATTAFTRRTTMRKAFLAPWHPLVEQLGLWFLAKAQHRTGTAIHSAHFVVNHEHITVTPPDEEADVLFRRIFHGELSKALNTLLAHERYDAPGEIFDDRQTHRMRLLDAEAQVAHHTYEHLNTTSAGLVARYEDMPGLKLSHRDWRGGPRVVERPPLYVDPRTNPSELPLTASPTPLAYRAFDGDLDAMVHHYDRLAEHGRRRIRDASRGRSPLGAKGVRRLHPWSEPKTLRETRGQRVPTYKVGARGLVGVQHEVDAARDTTRHRRLHREARLARRDGDLERAYPYGTYAARVHQGAPVSEPLPDAVVTAPGPTLEEVKDELAAMQRSAADVEERRTQRHRIVDEVTLAWTEEAGEVVEHDDAQMCRKVAVVADDASEEATSGAGEAPRKVEVRHRLDRRPNERSSAARTVTLRDRRRGRRSAKKPGGSDPPG